ncbi:MAG: glucose 1-dehydrogenase [Microbacteriaceae bacterium]|nr:glucose 1-dehydrogenase [Microbacteriaceae bacterium]
MHSALSMRLDVLRRGIAQINGEMRTRMDLNSRIAVVTGATTGIGQASKAALEKEGVRVVNWDITDQADVYCDVADEASVIHAMEWTLAHVGTPTLLVTSAGVSHQAPFVETTLESWDHVVGINLRGTFLVARAVAGAMVAAGLDGSFVFIASINGILADPQTLNYSVSKAGVIQMAKVLGNELGPKGIRVNAIAPGPTETAMLARPLADDAYRQMVIDSTALREVGTPQLVAEVVVGTMKMGWVTGQVILADGGATLVTARAAARTVLNAAR